MDQLLRPSLAEENRRERKHKQKSLKVILALEPRQFQYIKEDLMLFKTQMERVHSQLLLN